MNIFELIIIAVGLSMDAFAVAVCLGLAMPAVNIPKMLTVGLYFGFFQAAMPLGGYMLGTQFADKISSFDHWVAFILLLAIGAKMLMDSGKKDDKEENPALSPARMLPLAVATSIDALAVGISFAFLNVNIFFAVSSIGVITLILSMAGVKIGRVFGDRHKAKAEIAGGLILILMGLKILLEHI